MPPMQACPKKDSEREEAKEKAVAIRWPLRRSAWSKGAIALGDDLAAHAFMSKEVRNNSALSA